MTTVTAFLAIKRWQPIAIQHGFNNIDVEENDVISKKVSPRNAVIVVTNIKCRHQARNAVTNIEEKSSATVGVLL